jgi:cytochrome b pre-mRNA-processing protein 3
MIFHLFRRSPQNDSIARLYGAIVAQARLPHFYESVGVPDSVAGRFEMVVLHLVLVLRWLKSQGDPIHGMGQGLFDRFCQDMDDNLREMGVGDLAVPRQMRGIGGAFYGRQAAYEAALATRDDDALVATVARNIFGHEGKQHHCGAVQLANYLQTAWSNLGLQTADGVLRAGIKFPDPNLGSTQEKV